MNPCRELIAEVIVCRECPADAVNADFPSIDVVKSDVADAIASGSGVDYELVVARFAAVEELFACARLVVEDHNRAIDPGI